MQECISDACRLLLTLTIPPHGVKSEHARTSPQQTFFQRCTQTFILVDFVFRKSRVL